MGLNSLNIIYVIQPNPGFPEGEIAEAIGYKSGHIAQSRSRGSVSKRFLDSLKQYLARLQNSTHVPPSKMEDQQVSYGKEDTVTAALAKTLQNISDSNQILARVIEESQKMILNQLMTNTTRLLETKTDIEIVGAMQNAYHEYWAEHVPPKNQTPAQVIKTIHNKAFEKLQKQKQKGK